MSKLNLVVPITNVQLSTGFLIIPNRQFKKIFYSKIHKVKMFKNSQKIIKMVFLKILV